MTINIYVDRLYLSSTFNRFTTVLEQRKTDASTLKAHLHTQHAKYWCNEKLLRRV